MALERPSERVLSGGKGEVVKQLEMIVADGVGEVGKGCRFGVENGVRWTLRWTV